MLEIQIMLGTCGGVTLASLPVATPSCPVSLLSGTGGENKAERLIADINTGRSPINYPRPQSRVNLGKHICCPLKEIWMVRNKDKTPSTQPVPPNFTPSFPTPLSVSRGVGGQGRGATASP